MIGDSDNRSIVRVDVKLWKEGEEQREVSVGIAASKDQKNRISTISFTWRMTTLDYIGTSILIGLHKHILRAATPLAQTMLKQSRSEEERRRRESLREKGTQIAG